MRRGGEVVREPLRSPNMIDDNLRSRQRFFRVAVLIRSLHHNGAVIVAGLEDRHDSLAGVELHPLPRKVRIRQWIARSAASSTSGIHRLRLDIDEILIGEAPARGNKLRIHNRRSRGEHDLSFQLALPRTEI